MSISSRTTSPAVISKQIEDVVLRLKALPLDAPEQMGIERTLEKLLIELQARD